jgi:hypothetical protein
MLDTETDQELKSIRIGRLRECRAMLLHVRGLTAGKRKMGKERQVVQGMIRRLKHREARLAADVEGPGPSDV